MSITNYSYQEIGAGLVAVVALGYLGYEWVQHLSKDPLSETVNKLMKLDSYKKLYDTVQAEGSIKIRWSKKTEDFAPSFINPLTRELCISPSRKFKPTELMWFIIFETNNFLQAEKAKNIMQNPAKYQSATDYALALEDLEYETYTKSSKIFDEVVRKHLAKKNENPKKSKEEYREMTESTGHTDVYRQSWIERIRPDLLDAFIQKNRAKWLENYAKASD